MGKWATVALGLLELIGFLLVSYGLLRESFAVLAKPRAYGGGRYGEGPFGGSSRATRFFLRVGTASQLLPKDGDLTLTDHKRNAACAVAGVLVVALAIGGQIAQAIYDS